MNEIVLVLLRVSEGKHKKFFLGWGGSGYAFFFSISLTHNASSFLAMGLHPPTGFFCVVDVVLGHMSTCLVV